MSEGEIPISGLDIRQSAIVTPHLDDLAVTTPKIADVAVTIEKEEDPKWNYAAEPPTVSNVALTTTLTEFVSHTIDIPSWVGTLSIMSIGLLQPSNSSGGVQGYRLQVRYNDVVSGTAANDAASGGVCQVYHVESLQISTPGSSIEVSLYAATASGTNSVNGLALDVIAFGVR